MVRSLKNAKKMKCKNRAPKTEEGPSNPAKVWQPSVEKLEEGEEFQCDPSAYNSLHGFHIGFDVARDSLGLVWTEFPHSVYYITGTRV